MVAILKGHYKKCYSLKEKKLFDVTFYQLFFFFLLSVLKIIHVSSHGHTDTHSGSQKHYWVTKEGSNVL